MHRHFSLMRVHRSGSAIDMVERISNGIFVSSLTVKFSNVRQLISTVARLVLDIHCTTFSLRLRMQGTLTQDCLSLSPKESLLTLTSASHI